MDVVNKRKLVALYLNNKNNLLNQLLLLHNAINEKKQKKKLLRRKKSKLRFMILNYHQKINYYALELIKKNSCKKTYKWERNQLNVFFECELFNNGDIFFKDNLRINPTSFDELCLLLSRLEKEKNHHRIPLKKKIAIALYTLGSSANYRSIANKFGIRSSTIVRTIVLDFCLEVWKQLKNEYLNAYPLTDAIIKKNIKGFEKLGFPQCSGAIDGCHVEVKPHNDNTTDSYNFKKWYSTILLAVVDYKYDFMYINVGCPGDCSNSEVYERSSIKSHYLNNDIVHKNKRFIKSVIVPPFLIADSEFKLSKHVLTPYQFKVNADNSEKLFNYKLSKTKRVVKIAFRNLKTRFRRLDRGLNNQIDNTSLIIKVCCVLHNFLNAKKDEVNLNWMRLKIEEKKTRNRIQPDSFSDLDLNTRNGIVLRNAISLYFIDEAAEGGVDVDGTGDASGDE